MRQVKNLSNGAICYVDDEEWAKAGITGGQVTAYKKCKEMIYSEEYEETRRV